jgi:hypothetical protein
MDEPAPAVSEIQPWSIRTTRRAVQGVRNASLVVTNAVSGWGVGGFFLVLLVVAVLAVFVLGPIVSHHSDPPPCQQASTLVSRVRALQAQEHGTPLDPKSVRELHRIGARLTPIADHAYGSTKNPLRELATTVSGVQVGDLLHAQSTLDQLSIACDRI